MIVKKGNELNQALVEGQYYKGLYLRFRKQCNDLKINIRSIKKPIEHIAYTLMKKLNI